MRILRRAVIVAVAAMALSVPGAAAQTATPTPAPTATPTPTITPTPTLAGYTDHYRNDVGVLCIVYQGQVNGLACLNYTPTPGP